MDKMTNNQIQTLVQELVIAKLRSDTDDISEIAEKIGRSPTVVRNVLAKRKHGRFYYEPDIPNNCPLDEAEIFRRVDNLIGTEVMRRELRKISGDSLLKIDTVVDRPGERNDKIGFSVRTSVLLGRLLERSRTFTGLTWGNNIRPPRTSTPSLKPRSKEQKPLPFIPLCSVSEDPKIAITRSSTILASRFNRIYNEDFDGTDEEPEAYNLNGIPIANLFFSDIYYKQAKPEEKRRIEAVRLYVNQTHCDAIRILGNIGGVVDPSPELPVNKMDTVLTSCGPAGEHILDHLDRWFPNRKSVPINGSKGSKKTVSKKALAFEIAAGDLAGILLPNPGDNYEQNKLICDDVNSYLTTLRPAHLLNLRNKTMTAHNEYQQKVLLSKKKTRVGKKSLGREPAAGIIGIFNGPEQIKPMLCALSEGYLSRMMISQEIEDVLTGKITTLQLNDEPYSLTNLTS